MKEINKGIVFSNDIKRILEGNNGLDYRYQDKFIIPSSEYIGYLREDFKKDVISIFKDVVIISEEDMINSINESIKDIYGKYTIVSLDKIYLSNIDYIYLDCTRLDNSSTLVSRSNPNDLNSVINSIKRISRYLLDNNIKEIVLVDDVVFSGNVLKSIIELFKLNDINVVGIRTCISTTYGYNYFNSILKEGIVSGYIMSDNVIDEVCERDFYFGIIGSGISVMNNDKVYKAPYFKPYGDPSLRASIPLETVSFFSKGCLRRSINLWEEIEYLSKKKIYIKDLKEVIMNTNSEDRIIKVLKKEYDKI